MQKRKMKKINKKSNPYGATRYFNLTMVKSEPVTVVRKPVVYIIPWSSIFISTMSLLLIVLR